MAKFCTRCGSPLEETAKFCTKCGASMEAPSAPAPAPVTPQPAVAAAAAPAAPKKGGGALKIILGIVAVLALLGVLAVGACVFIVYKAKQKASQFAEKARTATMTFGTPEVHMEKGGKGSEAAATATQDVPPYPGATASEAGGEMSLGIGGISGQEYLTEDPVDKVVAFYKDTFGSKIHLQEAEGNASFQLVTKSGMTTVTITRDESAGKTKINIARIGK